MVWLALEGANGSTLWEVDQANSDLVVDEEGNIYFSYVTCGEVWPDSCRGTLKSVDASGHIRWQYPDLYLPDPTAVAGGVLLLRQGEIFDAATGTLRGSLPFYLINGVMGLDGRAVISPDGKIILINADQLIAFDGAAANHLWTATAFHEFWFTQPQLVSSGVLLMDDAQVRVIGLDGSSVSGTWLDLLIGPAALLDNGLFVSGNSRAAFELPGNPQLAQRGWIGGHGGSTGQNRAR
jgi:hypothetical protein